MTEIKLNIENLTDAEREQLMGLVDKANNPKSKLWKPEYGDKYWYIGYSGSVLPHTWLNNIDEEKAYDMGNCFRTKEEAKEEVTRRKMIKRWKNLSIESGEEENPWDGYAAHWYVYFPANCNKVVWGSDCTIHDANIFFATEEAAKAAIKELGEANVKKYILGVK